MARQSVFHVVPIWRARPDGRVFAAELSDRPRDRAASDRSATGDELGHVLDEHAPGAPALVASPHTLPPPQVDPGVAGDVAQHTDATPAPCRDHTAVRTPRRAAARRHRDRHHRLCAVDVLGMDAVESEQQVASSTRIGGVRSVRARGSIVRHVEVLGVDQRVSASDPRGPRPLPGRPHPARVAPTRCPKRRIRSASVRG
jgi:hypothetical protein